MSECQQSELIGKSFMFSQLSKNCHDMIMTTINIIDSCIRMIRHNKERLSWSFVFFVSGVTPAYRITFLGKMIRVLPTVMQSSASWRTVMHIMSSVGMIPLGHYSAQVRVTRQASSLRTSSARLFCSASTPIKKYSQ